ncbi:hypothetical protein T03_7183 [Trichinella britovi]|uniref:Uncharacterized protein n=1 Tax=Trichinella britovi TaxID=45882 RepID=A0A0V0YRU2_TRIBR|nr:hypothetical protein T03_7183 [Trichinella britovi]
MFYICCFPNLTVLEYLIKFCVEKFIFTLKAVRVGHYMYPGM